MRCSLLTGFQFDPMRPAVTVVYLKNPGWRKGLESSSVDGFALRGSGTSHANLIYITRLRNDEEMVSHNAGLKTWFVFQ